MFRKNLVFSQFTTTPHSPLSLQGTFKALNALGVYSHSYWLVIFGTTNSSRVLARERWQTYENSWKKTQYLMNTLYMIHIQRVHKYSPGTYRAVCQEVSIFWILVKREEGGGEWGEKNLARLERASEQQENCWPSTPLADGSISIRRKWVDTL